MRHDPKPERIRLLATDVDGVLTDGRIYMTDTGAEMKAFHVRDGSGIKYAQRAGIPVVFITGRSSSLVDRRARELGVTEVFQGAIDKREPFAKILDRHDLSPEDVAYVGDDLLDIPLLRQVGFAAAVADARPEVVEVCHVVLEARGGDGALREVVELILKAQGRWDSTLARYRERP
jgi:3-deoxy-D-manno-octulosonate 8-phosphate phosphatase (KDO 8-P phosphatase)